MKDRIISSAAKFISLYGIKRFTVDDIAKDLGISKKTIYKYFSSKNELISRFIKTSIEDNMNSTLEAIGKESTLIGKLNAALISHHKYQIPLEILLDIEKYYPEDWESIEKQRREKLKLFRSLICDGVNSGLLRSDLNIEIISLILDKSTRAIFEYKFLAENNLDINKSLKEIEKVLLYGLLNHNSQ